MKKMINSSKAIRHRLLALLRQYNTSTSSGIIPIMVHNWGEKVGYSLYPPVDTEARYLAEVFARDVAATFVHHLEKIKFNSLSQRAKNPGKQLSKEDQWAIADKLAAELALLPYEETMQAVVSAVEEWLFTCDLREIKQDEWSDEEAMKRVFYWWSIDLAVD